MVKTKLLHYESMERSDAIGLFIESEALVKRFRELLNDDGCRSAFKGIYVAKIPHIAENVVKVMKYVLDGKEDANRLKSELFNLRELTRKLQQEAEKKGYSPFAHNCDTIINIIDNMERWETGDNYPTIPKEVRDLFPSDEQCKTFVRTNYGKSHKVIANNYLEEKGVADPDSPKYVAVKTTLYNYFILPFKPKDGEERNNIYCDPSTFYKHFKY